MDNNLIIGSWVICSIMERSMNRMMDSNNNKWMGKVQIVESNKMGTTMIHLIVHVVKT